MGNDALEFCARFGGARFDLRVPVDALIGIYARESGHGLLFAESDDAPPSDSSRDAAGAKSAAKSPKPKRPTLKVIK
jgi:stringent starvation protein B